jgi:hypothetical protein
VLGTTMVLGVVLLLVASPVAALPSAPSAQVLAEPSPVLGTDMQRHLVYEILLQNRADVSVTIDRLVVRDAATHARIASFGPQALADLVLVLDSPAPTTTLPPGSTAFAFMDVRLPARGAVPKALTHRLVLSVQRPGGPSHRLIVEAAPTGVDRRAPVVLGRPLRGGNLLAADGCCSRGVHAHSLVPFGDRWLNAQRYAIDFLRLDETMSTTSVGDPARNESYVIWGADVLAVAPGDPGWDRRQHAAARSSPAPTRRPVGQQRPAGPGRRPFRAVRASAERERQGSRRRSRAARRRPGIGR